MNVAKAVLSKEALIALESVGNEVKFSMGEVLISGDKLNDEVEWTHTQGELEQYKFDHYKATAKTIAEGEKGMTIHDAEQEFGHHLTEGLSAS